MSFLVAVHFPFCMILVTFPSLFIMDMARLSADLHNTEIKIQTPVSVSRINESEGIRVKILGSTCL